MKDDATRSEPGLDASERLAGKYMTFQLAREIYGVGILDVREIIGLQRITPFPRAPAFVRGVINLRGRVIPVVDLRILFGMEACPTTDLTVIIVLQCRARERQLTIGVLVDQVLEVLAFDAARIEPPPDLGTRSTRSDFILGIGKSEHHVVMLLDSARVLSGEEAQAMADSSPGALAASPAA